MLAFSSVRSPFDRSAIVVLTQLVLGLRSSEVLGKVRDLDDSGRALPPRRQDEERSPRQKSDSTFGTSCLVRRSTSRSTILFSPGKPLRHMTNCGTGHSDTASRRCCPRSAPTLAVAHSPSPWSAASDQESSPQPLAGAPTTAIVEPAFPTIRCALTAVSRKK